MTIDALSPCKFSVIDLEDFLSNPPTGFQVETCSRGHRFVKSDPENCTVLMDDFESCKGKVVFQHSSGKTIKVHNLRDYTSVRKSLTSKRFYLLVLAGENKSSMDTKNGIKVLQRFVVVVDGSDPYIKWEMERGLDWTISSVAGESYRVEVDFSESLQAWLGDGFRILANGRKVKPTWKDTSFTLKYYSDALFDFPHWLGFSKRRFKVEFRQHYSKPLSFSDHLLWTNAATDADDLDSLLHPCFLGAEPPLKEAHLSLPAGRTSCFQQETKRGRCFQSSSQT